MSRASIFIGSLVLLLILGVAVLPFASGNMKLPRMPWRDPPLLEACETALQARLKAPSTYHRIDAVQTRAPIDCVKTSLAAGDTRAVAEAVCNGKDAERLTMLIEYDAANGFGVPIRGASKCTYDAINDPHGDDASEWMVRIDGKSRTEWLRDAIRNGSVQ